MAKSLRHIRGLKYGKNFNKIELCVLNVDGYGYPDSQCCFQTINYRLSEKMSKCNQDQVMSPCMIKVI